MGCHDVACRGRGRPLPYISNPKLQIGLGTAERSACPPEDSGGHATRILATLCAKPIDIFRISGFEILRVVSPTMTSNRSSMPRYAFLVVTSVLLVGASIR